MDLPGQLIHQQRDFASPRSSKCQCGSVDGDIGPISTKNRISLPVAVLRDLIPRDLREGCHCLFESAAIYGSRIGQKG